MNRFQDRHLLASLFLCALALRLLFIFFGAPYYYGSHVHLHQDTFSFTGCFLNLLNHGVYTFDIGNPDAYFYRLPGYPFFWGIHYLVFGAAGADVAASVTQAILDAAACVMVSGIVRSISGKRAAALLAGAIYACYPFVIVWVPQIATESLATFCTILFFRLLYGMPEGYRKWLLLGVVACLALYVRTYLGILVISGGIYPLLCGRERLLRRISFAAVFSLSFALALSPWVLRNIFLQHKAVILMGETPGYAAYGRDFTAFHNWVTLWDEDVSSHAGEVALRGRLTLPPLPDLSPGERRAIDEAVQLAYRSGGSFHARRVWAKVADPWYVENPEADRELARRFGTLRREFLEKRPLLAYTRVPLQNLRKLFLKSEVSAVGASGPKRMLVKGLFAYRSLLIMVGMGGIALVLLRRRTLAWPLAFYPLFMFLYITAIMRHLEMRYVLQADVIVIMFASVVIVSAMEWIGSSEGSLSERVTVHVNDQAKPS